MTVLVLSCLSTLDIPSSGLDVIYTERSLINLDTLEQQCQAVRSLWSMVRSGGYLILCEAFNDGLDEINSYRSAVGLEVISPPWHNRYLSLSEIKHLLDDDTAFTIKEFSGSYYFVSRVIHEAFLQVPSHLMQLGQSAILRSSPFLVVAKVKS